MSPSELLTEALAIMMERARIDFDHLSETEASLAAWDARQGRFFEAIEALPADPAHAGLKALAFAVIHSTDCGMPPNSGSLDGSFMADLWKAAGYPGAPS